MVGVNFHPHACTLVGRTNGCLQWSLVIMCSWFTRMSHGTK